MRHPDIERDIYRDAGCDGALATQCGGRSLRLGDDDDADRSGARGVCCAMGAIRGDEGSSGELDGFDADASSGREWHQRRGVRRGCAVLGTCCKSRWDVAALERGQ